MSEVEQFRETVEAFLKSRDLTPTKFGKEFAGDPLFVFELREGREPRTDTRLRILKAMNAVRSRRPAQQVASQ